MLSEISQSENDSDSIYMRIYKKEIHRDRRDYQWVARSVEGRSRETSLMLLVGVGENYKIFLTLNSGTGCTTQIHWIRHWMWGRTQMDILVLIDFISINTSLKKVTIGREKEWWPIALAGVLLNVQSSLLILLLSFVTGYLFFKKLSVR